MRIVMILLLLGAPFFFWGGPGAHGSRSFIALWDLGHVLFFFLASLWLVKFLSNRFSGCSISALFRDVFLIVLILGVIVESLQMLTGNRLPDVDDILRNQLGCLLALAFCYPQEGYKKIGFRFVLLALASIALIPLVRGGVDEWIAREQFPVLSDFETIFEADRWKNKKMFFIRKGISKQGEHSLQVRLSTDKYSGVSLTYFKKNWQGYSRLLFSVYNPENEILELVCRIHDSAHNNNYNDRFNRRFILRKGWNDLVVSLHDVENSPKDRLLDLSEVETIGFFVVEQKRERVIYLDSVYLE